MKLRMGLAAALSLLATLVSGAALAVPASAANVPGGYCSRGLHPGCVMSTWQISTLTENSDSIFLNKGDTLGLGLCKSWSNSGSLGGQFTPIKNYLNLNFGVSLTVSYQICTNATVKATSSGFWHWYGFAKRWQSKVWWGTLCGKGFCIPNYSYPIAQDRWFWRMVKG